MSKKEIAFIATGLVLLVGFLVFASKEAQRRDAERQEARNAWVGHPVYARVETGWTSPDVVIEGTVLGWAGEHAMVKNIHDGTIHPVYMSRITSR